MLNPHNLPPKEKLWQAMCQGNEKAFAQMFKVHYQALLAYGIKITIDSAIVQDAIQDVFVHLWNKRSTLPEVTNVRLYLFKSLRNRLLRILEQEGKLEKKTINEPMIVPSEEDSVVLHELKKEQLIKLHFHLQNLPIRQREAIHLKFFQNLKTSEIADLQEVNYQSVSNNIYRGLNTLKRKFQTFARSTEHKKIGNS